MLSDVFVCFVHAAAKIKRMYPAATLLLLIEQQSAELLATQAYCYVYA